MADRKNSFGRGKNETNIVWASAFQGDSRKTFTGPRRWGEGPKRRGTAKVIAHRRHSQAHPRISLWLMRATFLRSVVPAHAGTHNPGHSLLDEGDCRFAETKGRGVWVPACAGTTMNDGFTPLATLTAYRGAHAGYFAAAPITYGFSIAYIMLCVGVGTPSSRPSSATLPLRQGD